MEPTALQSDELLRMAGTARFVWNWARDRCQRFYKENQKGIPPREQVVRDHARLNGVPAKRISEGKLGIDPTSSEV
jgi:Helix-turn-helix domain